MKIAHCELDDYIEYVDTIDDLLERSKSEVWRVSMDKYEGPIDDTLVNVLKKINSKKYLLLHTTSPDLINKVKPYSIYMANYTFDLDVLKSSQDNNCKIVYNSCFEKEDWETVIDKLQRVISVNSSPVFLISNPDGDWDRLIPRIEGIAPKMIYLDLPLCIANRYNLESSTRKLDVEEYIIHGKLSPSPKQEFIDQFVKLSSHKDCVNFRNCYGNLKSNPSTVFPVDQKVEYHNICDRVINSPDVSIGVLHSNPKNWENEFGTTLIDVLQDCRVNRNFDGRNFFYIWDWKESVFFNRPLEGGQVWKEDPRGLMSMNWKFIGSDKPELRWKQKCDCLLPHYGFVTAAKIKFTDEWSRQKRDSLNVFTLSTIIDIIIRHGGERDKITQVSNDILYNGKKFCGKEWSYFPSVGYIENTLVTCDYEKEKKWFDLIYHYDGERPITGITNEVPTVTKEVLIKELYEAMKVFFNNLRG